MAAKSTRSLLTVEEKKRMKTMERLEWVRLIDNLEMWFLKMQAMEAKEVL